MLYYTVDTSLPGTVITAIVYYNIQMIYPERRSNESTNDTLTAYS